jgi:hypothetical protein
MILAQVLLSFQNRLTTDTIIATTSGGTTEALGVENQTEIKACSNIMMSLWLLGTEEDTHLHGISNITAKRG